MLKLFITPNSLRKDSFKLGSLVIKSGFEPDMTISVWRGGGPIGLPLQELLKFFGIKTDHVAIKTSRSTGINKFSQIVDVQDLSYVTERVNKDTKLLLVDDVYESGLSIDAILKELKEKMGDNMPTDIRIATAYYKPTKNKTSRNPDYYVNITDEWIVFPHEIEGLTLDEIYENFGEEIGDIVKECIALRG